MKIALYIENSAQQIVLTPENDTEKQLLAKMHGKTNFSIHKGSFYQCVGGWVRQGSDDTSTIIRLVDE